jgi:hypothetical protein
MQNKANVGTKGYNFKEVEDSSINKRELNTRGLEPHSDTVRQVIMISAQHFNIQIAPSSIPSIIPAAAFQLHPV